MSEAEKKKKMKFIIIFVILLIVVDQTTKFAATIMQENKIIIENVFQFALEENKGGAFGVGQDSTGTFIITNVIVLGTIIRFILLQLEKMDNKTIVMLCLILAGGFSNLVDRLFRGYVVDFINIFPNANLPIFNFADTYIIVGWVVLAAIFAGYTYKELQESKKQRSNE